jgi:iron complex outermembrane receptor protein
MASRGLAGAAGLCGALLAMGGVDAWAQVPGARREPERIVVAQAETRAFNIPAQPFAAALIAFGQQSGLQVTVDSELVAGRQARPVVGQFAPAEALRRLLAGTGLDWRRIDAQTVALEKAANASTPEVTTLTSVVVTGERANRSLRDTATSVAVLDARTLEQRPAIASTNDALERIPNVVSSGTGNLAPAVRGLDGTGPAQGADAFFAGTRPRLNVQIDGRPASYNEVIFGDVSLWDVEQIEVLRGPQSSLQGRNAIAGTVVVKTKDPTFDWEGGLRLIGGGYDLRQGSAMISGPIIEDQLAFRLAADNRYSESFVNMNGYPGVAHPEDIKTLNLRGKLLMKPAGMEGFQALLTVTHSEHTAPQSESVLRPFDEHMVSYATMPTFNPRSTGGTLESKWTLNDNIDLEATASLTDIRITRRALAADGNAVIDATEYTAEPRIRFTALDGRLRGLGGIYLFRNTQDETIDLFGGGAFDDKTTTVAGFAEATLAVLDDLDLTLGARLEREKRRRTGADGPFAIDFDETYTVFLPKLGLAWHATDSLTIGAVVSRGYNGGGAGFTYDPPFTSYTFKPEYAWNYEAYARADFDEGRLSLIGNVFVADYKDMQLPFDLNPDPAIWSVVIRNADRVLTYGAELGARWLPLPGLELSASVGLLKTEVTKYRNSDLQGNDLPRAPAVTADVAALYRHSSGLEFGVDARFSDAYHSSIDNSSRGKTDPYVVFNAQVGYTFDTDLASFRAFAFVRNIFDAGTAILIEPGATKADDVGYLLQPRTVGVGLQMTF